MTRKQNGAGLALAVAAGCLALLLLLIALATRSGAEDDNPAVGFPIVLGGLIVIATLVALGWRAVTRKSHSDR
ncbi:MAG: hypothetical protein JWM62_1491 [Frankiales bacterium]|jgi:hypothetical protein|nr:hypothetical protein [Frankiales bacterium]